MHYVLMNMELAFHEGADNALEQALVSFEHYWQPENIGAVASPITEWLPRQTYGGLRERGRQAIKAYHDLLKGDDSKLLALEYQFAVPLEISTCSAYAAASWTRRSATSSWLIRDGCHRST